MKIKEAIEELHKIRPSGAVIPQKRAEAIDKAVEALEKQIPMKPVRITWANRRCPRCNEFLNWIDFPCKCGQAIDWSEEE